MPVPDSFAFFIDPSTTPSIAFPLLSAILTLRKTNAAAKVKNALYRRGNKGDKMYKWLGKQGVKKRSATYYAKGNLTTWASTNFSRTLT